MDRPVHIMIDSASLRIHSGNGAAAFRIPNSRCDKAVPRPACDRSALGGSEWCVRRICHDSGQTALGSYVLCGSTEWVGASGKRGRGRRNVPGDNEAQRGGPKRQTNCGMTPGNREKSRSAVRIWLTPCSLQTAAIWASNARLPRTSEASHVSRK